MNPLKCFYSWIRSRPSRNSSREYLAEFAQHAADSVPAGSLVLDAGSSPDAPYYPCFGKHRYESADMRGESDKVTYVCNLTSIPVENDRFDLVLCTQVLEHVPYPDQVVRELYRVLKPGCRLWLSTPLFYEEHMQPHDFFRYTRFGLPRLFEEAGFTIEELVELEGYYGTLSYEMDVARRSLPVSPSHYGGGALGIVAAVFAMVLVPVFHLLSQFYAGLDRRVKYTESGHCKNYCVVARKQV
jgi:SAM-dependent methyltransferase